jgi:hypothetical protein
MKSHSVCLSNAASLSTANDSTNAFSLEVEKTESMNLGERLGSRSTGFLSKVRRFERRKLIMIECDDLEIKAREKISRRSIDEARIRRSTSRIQLPNSASRSKLPTDSVKHHRCD